MTAKIHEFFDYFFCSKEILSQFPDENSSRNSCIFNWRQDFLSNFKKWGLDIFLLKQINSHGYSVSEFKAVMQATILFNSLWMFQKTISFHLCIKIEKISFLTLQLEKEMKLKVAFSSLGKFTHKFSLMVSLMVTCCNCCNGAKKIKK